jgi:RNA polymerase sigma-70 factor (ECF subfamily)
VERYGDVLFGTAYLMARNHAVAEELVQDTFLLAWRGLEGFRGGSLKAWLVRILVNRTISQGRRKSLDPAPLEEASEVRGLAGPEADPAEATVQALEGQGVRRALDALPEEQRQVVLLRYFAELSVEEAARALGVRPGTVKSRLFRALERLREILAPEGSAFLGPHPGTGG